MKITNAISRFSVSLITIVCLLIAPASASAAIYLKLEGLDGDVTAVGYENWINLTTLTEGIAVSASTVSGSGGSTASKPVFSDISVTKLLDIASPYLRQTLVQGRPIESAVISLVTTSTEKTREYFRIELTNVLLTSVSMTAGGDIPDESVTFTFDTIVWTYFPVGKTGSVGTPIPAGYDLTTNSTI